jgi:hypothetical protein
MRSAFHEAAYTKGRTHHQSRQAPGVRTQALALMLALALSFLILFLFYDRFWWAADDGAYAHIALRILDGAVLNREIQDLHAGYINFANALALWLFGADVVSMRYPLMALGLVQAFLAYLLLVRYGAACAVAAAVGLTALSFVQFLNPTAHWYALCLTIAVIGALAWMREEAPLRADIIGFLLVSLLLFRQLSGVIVAVGVVAWLLLNAEPARRRGHSWLARLIFAVMTAGVCTYLFKKTDAMGWMLFGIWPVAVLALGALRADPDNRWTVGLIARLTRGGLVAVLPLAAYHLFHGSFDLWFNDTVMTALALTELDFMRQPVYTLMLVQSLQNIAALSDFSVVINGLFWLGLLALPVLNGLIALKALTQRETLHPLPFIAVFYALVSAHFQIPIYLFYSSGLSLVALLWSLSEGPSSRRHIAIGFAVAMTAVALHFHAGQALSRGLAGILRGERIDIVESGLPNVSLRLPAAEAAQYRGLVDIVERHVPEDGSIFAIPLDPQLYVLTGRNNPFRFYNTAFGLTNESELRWALLRLTRNPPNLVFYRPDDKYNTQMSARLMAALKIDYELIDRRDGLEIYRLRNAASAYVR